jgi:sigma-54 dependent transcriptional regulator, acetoin dehydrogenase operon transcriptional activator AcoR
LFRPTTAEADVTIPVHTPLPPEQRLALIERARLSVLESQDSTPSPWLAASIERSWRRCLAMGQDPHQRVAFDPVSAGAMRQALEASQPLIQAAAPVIRSLSRAMVHTRYFAILTDARGTVIDVDGPVDRSNPRAAAIARVGVDLSERAVGTTAIGTTLTDLEPVWLHRGEHFFHDNGAFSCAGAPIWGPDGHCVGMLDLTGIDVAEQPALKHLVTQSARSIENALTTSRPHRMLLRLNWPGRVLGDDNDGLVCVDDDGRITGANRAASDMLGLMPQQGTMHCSEVFAVPTDGLFDAARAQRPAFEVPLWSGLRLQLLAQGPGRVSGAPRPASHSVPLKDVEAALIRRAVEDARGNVMEAARALGISRATVYRKLTKKK